MLIDAILKQASLDQKTSWNSSYLMIDRLLELEGFSQQKAPLVKGLKFSDANWEKLRVIINIEAN